MLVFRNGFKYHKPFHIVFLCGSKFVYSNRRDKRNVLQCYINENIDNYHSVILEKHFSFGKTNKNYLAYDDIYLNGLAQVEQLASLFADKIIIIHETISTGAEVGMFASDQNLVNKVCLLVADKDSVEEDKTGSFIKLAFLNNKSEETQVKLITYYPDVEIFRFSENKSDYHTFFHGDQIGDFLSAQLNDFLQVDKTEYIITLNKAKYGDESLHKNDFSYVLTKKEIIVSVPMEVLRIQLFSLLYLEVIRNELRKEKQIRDHITYLYDQYRIILKNTINNFVETDVSDFALTIRIGKSMCDAKQAVGYFLYLLQSIEFVGLEQQTNRDLSIRKVRLSVKLNSYEKEFKNYVYNTSETVFGRLMK